MALEASCASQQLEVPMQKSKVRIEGKAKRAITKPSNSDRKKVLQKEETSLLRPKRKTESRLSWKWDLVV